MQIMCRSSYRDLDLISLCLAAAFPCLACSEGPNHRSSSADVVCGQLPAATLPVPAAVPFPASPQRRGPAAWCGSWDPAGGGLGKLGGFEMLVLAGVGQRAIMCPCASPASGGAWPRWLVPYSRLEALCLEVSLEFSWCSAECGRLCYRGHVCLSAVCQEKGPVT